ncbi:MAG: hypothetical protein LAP38_15410, partial [Acidobacteriia bacterium]|nr:hypothetical protein [Terriglobia bacterium]
VAVLYTDPLSGDRARQLFENIMRQRLERLGASASFVLAALEDEAAVARSLQHLLRAKPTCVLVASTTAPGCFRSAKPNVVDLILPPMLARYRVSGWEIASLGHGGLLA